MIGQKPPNLATASGRQTIFCGIMAAIVGGVMGIPHWLAGNFGMSAIMIGIGVAWIIATHPPETW